MFAAIMMIMVGIFQALQGLIAIFENEFYVATRNYLFQFDATTWGWIHLLLGLLVAFAGYGLLSGKTWARTVAIFLARAQRHRQLPVHPLLPVLVAAHHHPGRLRDLGRRRPRGGPARAGLNPGAGCHPLWVEGSSTWKRVSPGAEVKRRSPWRRTTIREQMSSPRPVPWPTGLVV